jgi:DNA replication and repair protein RecF
VPDGSVTVELSRLTVRSFRNLAALDLDLPPRGVVVIGDNGQGKTNLLEAIYYLVLFRSLRGVKDRELVRFGEAGFFVAGESGVRVTAGYEVAGGRKKVTVDGTPVTRLGEAVGQVLAVSFSPADRALVSGGPAERRRYLDVLLSLSDRAYLESLSVLRAALRQRNAALRRGQPAAAWAFDRPLAGAAAAVASRRLDWVARHRARFTALTTALGEHETAEMEYHVHRGGGTEPESVLEGLAGARDRDTRRGVTTVGPHRDELRLTLGGHDARPVGSAGQQRTAALALRLLEAESLERAHGTTPLALFDDAFAELDAARQARLLTLIAETLPGQAIVTAPRAAEVPAALLDRPRWRMHGGRIEA